MFDLGNAIVSAGLAVGMGLCVGTMVALVALELAKLTGFKLSERFVTVLAFRACSAGRESESYSSAIRSHCLQFGWPLFARWWHC